jgi:hypothetical protein
MYFQFPFGRKNAAVAQMEKLSTKFSERIIT